MNCPVDRTRMIICCW